MSLELLSLQGKRALVTGGGTGLGRQMAIGLAEAGAEIVISGRRAELLEESVRQIHALGADATAIPADVTSDAGQQKIKEGAGRIDILVNNAGYSIMHPWPDVTVAQWREVMTVNLEAPFRLIQIFGPGMVERRWGRIINISSIYGVIAGDPRRYPGINWDAPAYFASKHGVHGLTHYFGVMLAPYGVCVNSISPGMFLTEGTEELMTPAVRDELVDGTPMHRIGGKDDIKAACILLASPGAKFITGQNLIVDGGWTVW
jgi:NAD(P)-dependent dehydrogenase (short-subunit alcohol dehydrogenase family)